MNSKKTSLETGRLLAAGVTSEMTTGMRVAAMGKERRVRGMEISFEEMWVLRQGAKFNFGWDNNTLKFLILYCSMSNNITSLHQQIFLVVY